MDTVKLILPLLGVIIGFLLSLIKEWFQNKAIIKTNIKYGKGNGFGYYYYSYKNKEPIQTSSISVSDFFDLSIKIDTYNIGKKNTAIKDVRIEIFYQDRFFRNEEPILVINDQKISSRSFNLMSGEILTLNINLTVLKDQNNLSLFRDDISFTPEESDLLFKVVITDIYGKKYYEIVEPLGIYLLGAPERKFT